MFPNKVNKINEEIELLEKSIVVLEGELQELDDDENIFKKYWALKETHENLKNKYRSLQIWSDRQQQEKLGLNTIKEIYYFEICLKMLRNKRGARKIDLRHFLNVAELEYDYFKYRENILPKEFLTSGFQVEGYFKDAAMNLIFNNIKNAQENLLYLLEHLNQEKNDKDLFIYYEVMGDLFIHLFLYITEYYAFLPTNLKEDKSFSREYLRFALYYYRLSIWHKKKIEEQNPTTGFDGLHGWNSQRLFHNFFNRIGVNNVHDVREKDKKLREKFSISSDEENKIESKFNRENNGK